MNFSTLKQDDARAAIDGERNFSKVEKSEKVYRRESAGGISAAPSLCLVTPVQLPSEPKPLPRMSAIPQERST
jgi:hypothetical protein